MKVEIYAEPRFKLSLTMKHIEILTRCALDHYDSTCKNAAKFGGFIYVWGSNKASIETWNEENSDIPLENVAYATGRQLDLCTKILEQRSMLTKADQEMAAEMIQIFLKALRAGNETFGASKVVEITASS